MNKKTLYNMVGILTSFVYLLGILISLFSVDKFEFFSTLIKIGLLFFIPAIYSIFSGIGQILELLTQLNNKLNESEEVEKELQEENDTTSTISTENEIESEIVDSENSEENLEENEDITPQPEEEISDEKSSESVIKNGKIQCRYCGKFNKMKRTYCYMCAKKLKD